MYTAAQAAAADARDYGSLEVPLHLRNAPTALMRELGYGKQYRYAHDEPDASRAGERYFPEDMPDRAGIIIPCLAVSSSGFARKLEDIERRKREAQSQPKRSR